jgi:hypothetical protein
MRSLLFCVALTCWPAAASASPRVILGYETGPAYVAQNDGRYGEAGTPYEAGDVGQQDTLIVSRRATVELRSGRHALVALYAPFELKTRVALPEDLQFRDEMFSAGTVVDHRYVFDGFRLSYLYGVLPRGPWQLEAGASLQIRSALVAFTSVDGMQHTEQANIGPVGALKVRATYQAGERSWGQLEADALSTFGLVGDTSGAIYDVALSAGRTVRRGVDAYVTLRLLGGGAEVPSQAIDNWGNYLSASAGLRVELGSL